MFVFATVLYGTPGPATLSLAASGGAYGFRKSVPYLLGVISGVFFNFLLVALGVAYLFQNYPVVYDVFKYISLSYVLYLAYRIATSGSIKSETCSPLRFIQGVILNLLNPKAYVAALATVSQFTVPGEAYYRSTLVVIIVVMITATIVDFLWVYAGGLMGKVFSTEASARIVNIVLALVLALSVIYATFFLGW